MAGWSTASRSLTLFVLPLYIFKKERKSTRSRLYAIRVLEDEPSKADFKSSHSFNNVNCAGDMSSSLANDLFCAHIRFP